MWGPGMGLGSGTGHIRLGPGPWAMIPSRQPGHGFETAGPSVLPPPSLVSAFATCCVPRLVQPVELHAVWLVPPVRPSPSLTVIGICDMLCASAGAAENEKMSNVSLVLKIWRLDGCCSLSLFGWFLTVNELSNAG